MFYQCPKQNGVLPAHLEGRQALHYTLFIGFRRLPCSVPSAMMHTIVNCLQSLSLSLSLTFSFPPYALSLSRSLGPLRKHELLQEKRCDSDDGTRAVGILKALAHVVSLAGCILEGCCSPRKDWQFGYDWDKSCRSSLRGEIGLCPGAGAACATHAVVFCLQTCKLQAVLEMEQSRSRLSAAEAALAQKGKVRDGSRRVAPGSG